MAFVIITKRGYPSKRDYDALYVYTTLLFSSFGNAQCFAGLLYMSTGGRNLHVDGLSLERYRCESVNMLLEKQKGERVCALK